MGKIDIACIVDDDPIFVFATKKVMQNAGFCESFIIYRNGKEALDGLQEIVSSGGLLPDVILLDLNMPVMDGWQFLDEFVKIKLPRPITIYIVSSSIDPEDMIRAAQYEQVEKYITKPITQKTLSDIVSTRGQKG